MKTQSIQSLLLKLGFKDISKLMKSHHTQFEFLILLAEDEEKLLKGFDSIELSDELSKLKRRRQDVLLDMIRKGIVIEKKTFALPVFKKYTLVDSDESSSFSDSIKKIIKKIRGEEVKLAENEKFIFDFYYYNYLDDAAPDQFRHVY